MTRQRVIETETADFRTYVPFKVVEDDGAVIEMTLCEDLVDGRWEPFYASRRVA